MDIRYLLTFLTMYDIIYIQTINLSLVENKAFLKIKIKKRGEYK